MKNAKKWLRLTGNILLWVFVVFSVLVTVLVFSATANGDGVPSLGGISPITVRTNSMSPTFKAGDLIFCKMIPDIEKPNIEIDDVITYYVDLDGDGVMEINSHRVIDKYEERGYVYYVTKGDNTETNPVKDDKPVMFSDVICVWSGSKIPGVGNFIEFLQSQVGFFVLIVLPLILFFLYELYRFMMVIMELRTKKKNVQLTAAAEEEIKRRAVEEYLKSQAAQAPAQPTESAPAEEAAPRDNGDTPADE